MSRFLGKLNTCYRCGRRDRLNQLPAGRHGFTLIEITIAAALLALFLVIALGSITNLTNLFQQTQAVQNNQQAALLMIEAIKREAAFAVNVQAVPIAPPAPVNDTEPILNGLCINRNANGQVLFFIAEDPSGPAKFRNITSANYNDPTGYENDQIDGPNGFYLSSGRPSYVGPGPDYFAVKHLYRSDNCSIHDPANTAHVSKVGGNSGLINNTNVQFFSVQTVTTAHDQTTLSYAVGLEVTQLGPPGIVINASNPGKQFDDTVVMRTVIYPNVLP